MVLINSSGSSYLSTQLMRKEKPPSPTLQRPSGQLFPRLCLHFYFFEFLLCCTAVAHGWPRPAPRAQSMRSTLPRIRPSYMGSTVSSSQISSNTAPQANSSLAFLK